MAGYQPGSPAVDRLDPTLRSIALRIVSESGGRVWIGSGYRDIAQQTKLYNAWKSGTYHVPSVAPPGRSKHNHGLAVDFGGDLRLAQQLGRKYGLIFPVRGEAWHGQLGSGLTAKVLASKGVPDWSFNLGDVAGANPQEVLANRTHVMMRLLGLNGEPFNMVETMESPTADTPGSDLVSDLAERGVFSGGEAPVQSAGAQAMAARREAVEKLKGGISAGIGAAAMAGGQKLPGSNIADPRGFGAYAKSLFKQFGWKPEQYPYLVWLWNKESGNPAAGTRRVTWNNLAKNPHSTAFGIAQFLNGTWAGTGIKKTTDAKLQMLAGMMYIAARYKTPHNALMFHMNHNWY